MKTFFLTFITFCALNSFGQKFKKNSNESTIEFVNRVKPNENAKISGNIIESREWSASPNIIIVFFLVKENQKVDNENIELTNLDGYIYFSKDGNIYKRIKIDSYGEEGAEPKIETLFFANVDKDKERELVVLCSWNQDKHAEPISGNLYQAYFYDNLNSNNLPEVLTSINMEKYFPSEFDGTNDSGEISHAKYRNAFQIKSKLKKLGF